MIILCTGDWHIRANRPENRIDNYKKSLFKKLEWILNQEFTVLQPGDFFDSPMAPYSLTLETTQFLKTFCYTPIYTVFGQHDLRYHTSKENSPLALLNEVEQVEVIGIKNIMDISIYGCSWGEEIPKITTNSRINILLIHKMIVDEKLWAEQEGHTWANHILANNNFDLIVSGDNHKSFIVEWGDKILVNCGSLMRSRIDQKDHKPMIVTYDTDTKEVEYQYIPVKPIEEVMDLKEKEKERNEELEAFVKGLSQQKEMGLNFVESLFQFIEDNKIDNSIKTYIEESL
jgi:DNA repair exonuclease SbcCD nuclease subunit